jgi:hypothetical protein
VRVFSYLQDRERTLNSPTEKLLLSVSTFADEMERVKARARTRDAMVRKARAGHVAAGRKYGYDNVAMTGTESPGGLILRVSPFSISRVHGAGACRWRTRSARGRPA